MARTVTLGGGAGFGAGAPGPATGSAPAGHGRRTLGKHGGSLQLTGDTFYLWLLLALELAGTWALRRWSRNHHGG